MPDSARREPGRLRIARTLQGPVQAAKVHRDCVAADEQASSLVTLALVGPEQEDLLRRLTRYLRARGQAASALELIFAQPYPQALTRGALAKLDAYCAIFIPTLAMSLMLVGRFEQVGSPDNFEPLRRFTAFTAIYTVFGQPAVSVPRHRTTVGPSIGVMLGGRMGEEGTPISLSAQLEAARPWRGRPLQ